MTGDRRPPPRRAQLLRRVSCAVLTVGGLALAGLLGLAVLLSYGIRECNRPPFIAGASDAVRITLDAAHPVAEQLITVRIPAQTLPASVPEGGITLSIDPTVVDPLSAPDSPSPDPAEPALDVAIMGLDDDVRPGRLVPAADTAVLSELPYARSAILDCQREATCERTFRVIVSLAATPPVTPVGVWWSARLLIGSSAFGGCAELPPPPVVEASTPVTSGAQLASAALEPAGGSGTVVATHVSVATDSVADVAWARLRLQVEPNRWMPWIRVIDDAGRRLVDGPAGRPWAPQADSLIEFPILTRCAEGVACSDGFWVIVQSIPSDVPPFEPRWVPTESPPRWTWWASVSVLGSGNAPPTGARIAIDDTLPDPGPVPAVEVTGPTVLLVDGVTRSVAASIHVPAQTALAAGHDWRMGAVAVASWYGQGIAVGSWLEGDGAGAIRGGANGGGSANLVAHPFDECPANGPCDIRLELVSRYDDDPHATIGGDPSSTWSLGLLGVPADSTVTFGEVVDLPDTGDTLGSPTWLPILIAGVAAGAVLVLVYRRRRAG